MEVIALFFLVTASIGGVAWVFVYEMVGEDADGNIVGRHRSTGIGRPRFWDRARYYGEEQRLATALDAAEAVTDQVRS